LGGRGRWIFEFEASLVYRVTNKQANKQKTTRKPYVLEKSLKTLERL
jgi:hypothetical protein